MNYYETLEISQNASPEVVKAAYRSLMQRYHPDKNPGNAAVAERAAQVAQAYEVISDPVQRTAYDLQLKNQASAQALERSPQRAYTHAATAPSMQPRSSYWLVWLVIISVIATSWYMISSSRKEHLSRQVTAKQDTPVQTQPPDSASNEAAAQPNTGEIRTLSHFITDLAINLKRIDHVTLPGGGTQPGGTTQVILETGDVLEIPSMDFKVGSYDADKTIQYLEQNRDSIIKSLSEQLMFAQMSGKDKIEGEAYLRELLLDKLDQLAGTDRHKPYPASASESPGHYGVIDVYLPEIYTVRPRCQVEHTC